MNIEELIKKLNHLKKTGIIFNETEIYTIYEDDIGKLDDVGWDSDGIYLEFEV